MIPALVVVAAMLAAACGGDDDEVDAAGTADRISVVASIYPLADAAERVGGERVEVVNVTPAGAEPHDIELSPRQVEDIEDADVVLALGGGFQPAVEDVAGRADGVVVDVLERLDVEGDDPHVWLDPVLMADIVEEVAAALTEADPDGSDAYERNADALAEELAELDEEYEARLGTCDRDLLVTAHEAFGRLTDRYGLRQEGIAGVSPDAEPDPRRLAELADLVEDEGVTTVFTEELLSPRVAESLAREAGVKTAVLDPLESLSDDDADAGATYVTVMEDNLATIADALGCD
jgi:zinc transport system substrate-binding protein